MLSRDNPQELTPSAHEKGYLCVALFYPTRLSAKTVRVHRIIAYAAWQDALFSHDVEVHHINEIKTDNRIENLELVSHITNIRYSSQGEKHHEAKLTEIAVQEIRRRFQPYGGKNSGASLAKEFGVDVTTISDVVRLKSWRHVP